MHYSAESQSTEIIFGRKNKASRTRYILCGLIVLVIAFVIGLLIGRYAICSDGGSGQGGDSKSKPVIDDSIIKEADPRIADDILAQISRDNIREYLRDLSEVPHLAGTDADYRQAKELVDFWEAQGLDETFLTPYDILLSYPNNEDEDQMNRLFIYDTYNNTVWRSELREPILHPSENKSNVVPPFNAFSAPGDIYSTDLVYVNYGREEDFKWLSTNRSISVNGTIVLARYGKIFRGDKVNQAQRYGARGIIIYSDPADYDEGHMSSAYPDDWWLPDTGVQRGTVYLGKGDPLTPGYPATDTAFRLKEDDPSLRVAKIPVHPIGYGVASKLLSYMTGEEVPSEWQGALNLTYRFGGTLDVGGSNGTLRMRISTRNERRTTYNAFGIIRGRVEPDRYVLVGNHRDAWVFGAIDPSSGTAVMKEVSRVMGNMVKSEKWRPRRTIIFCSWGAEEYGLIGSTEWIEEYVRTLTQRTVSYINIDIAVEANYSLTVQATPLLFSTAHSAAKRVPTPDNTDKAAGLNTVYDKWMKAIPNEQRTKPNIKVMGSGSDYASFVQQAGIPCVDFSYTYDKEKYSISSYPLYHSKYETFYAVDVLIDRGFHVHKAVAQTIAEAARSLADSLVLPFDVKDYSTELSALVDTLYNDYGKKMEDNGLNFTYIRSASEKFTAAVEMFSTSVTNVDKKDPFAIRRINDQLMLIDRSFIDPNGLPDRPLARHLLFAESSVNTYAGSSFPGLVDSMFEIDKATNKTERWNAVKNHYSAIVFAIEAAAASLKDSVKFMEK